MKTIEELRAHHLYKFLYKNGVLDKFIINVSNNRYSSSKRAYALGFLEGKNSLLTLMKECININYSFTWSETPEGHKFWSDLHHKQTDDFRKVWEDYVRISC